MGHDGPPGRHCDVHRHPGPAPHIVTGAGALSDPRAVAGHPGGLVISSDASGSGARADVVTAAPDRIKTGGGGRKKAHETGPSEVDTLEGERLTELQYPLPSSVEEVLEARPNPALEAREKAKYNKAVTTLYPPRPVTVKVVEARSGKLVTTWRK